MKNSFKLSLAFFTLFNLNSCVNTSKNESLENKANTNLLEYKPFINTAQGIILGNVINKRNIGGNPSCYHTEYKIIIDEIIKGQDLFSSRDTIKILGADGNLDNGMSVVVAGEKSFDNDQRYIFFLMNKTLTEYLQRHTQCVGQYTKNTYLASFTSPKVKDGLVVEKYPIPIHQSYSSFRDFIISVLSLNKQH